MKWFSARPWLAGFVAALVACAVARAGVLGLSAETNADGGATIRVEVGPEQRGRVIFVGRPGGSPFSSLGEVFPNRARVEPIYLVRVGERGVPPLVLEPDDPLLVRLPPLAAILTERAPFLVNCGFRAGEAVTMRPLDVRVDEGAVGEAWISMQDLPAVSSAVAHMLANADEPLTLASVLLRGERTLGIATLRSSSAMPGIRLAVERVIEDEAAVAEFRFDWRLPPAAPAAMLVVSFPVEPFGEATDAYWVAERSIHSAPTAIRHITGEGAATLRVPADWLRYGPIGLEQHGEELPAGSEGWYVTIAPAIHTTVQARAGSGDLHWKADALPEDQWFVGDAPWRSTAANSDLPSIDFQLFPDEVTRHRHFWTMVLQEHLSMSPAAIGIDD